MAIIKTIPRGQSLTITYVFPEDYDMSRIVELETVIGQTVFEHIIEGQTAIVRLKSSDTQPMLGQQQVTLMLEDSLLGVQKPYSGIITIGTSYSKYSSDATSGLSSIVIPIVIDETIITADDVLYNYFRCKSAYELAVEGGYTGTEEEFNEDLATFRFWSEQAEAAAQQTAADALQTALDRIATGEDRVQTGQDVQTTAGHVIQTGFDVQTTAQSVIDAEAARDKAERWAENPEDVAVETGKFSALHWAAKALAIFNNIVAAISGKEDSANKKQSITNSATDYPSGAAVTTALATKQNTIGYTPENEANKRTTFQATPTNTAYPSEKLVKDSLDLKADKSTVTQKIYLMLYEVATVVTGVITAVKKLWTEYSDRVTADAGTTTSLTNTERIYKMMVDNGMFNSLAFGWAADGGYKPRTSGVLTFFTKIYNFFGTNDAAQATALNQPYRFFDGGMKNVGNQFLTMTAETLTASEQWTLTARLRWDGSNNAIAGIFGKGSDTLSIIGLRVASVNRFRFINESGTAVDGASGANNRIIGKFVTLHFIASGSTLAIYVDNTLIETLTVNTNFVLSSFLKAYSTTLRNFGGNLKYVYLFRGVQLSSTQRTAEHALLSTLYPEIPSVTIGSQTWQLYNNEMVATPMGNVIQEVQAAANVERITNAADREFSSDTGFWIKRGTAVIADGVGRFTGLGNIVFGDANWAFAVPTNLIVANRWQVAIFRFRRISGTGSIRAAFGFNNPTTYNSTADWQTVALASNGAEYSNTKLCFGSDSTTSVFEIDDVSSLEVGWSGSQALYDAIYAQTSGTVAQKTTAALRAASMWRYPNNDSAIGSWAGKLFNKFAFKLMHEDILAFNAANPSTPWGYAVPTRAQLTTLAAVGGNAAKVTGNSYWNTANGTNTSGLSLLGTGFIQANGTYTDNKASTLIMCHDADFARKVVDGDNTFDEVSITTEGGVLRFIKV